MNFKQLYILLAFILGVLQLHVYAEDHPLLHLQLDKTYYVSGETIRFKNTLTDYEEGKNSILFIDMCGEGYLLSSAVVQRSNSHWQGELVIPDSVQTGVYLIRAYTGNESGNPTLVSQLIPVFNRFGHNGYNEEKKKQNRNQPFYCSKQNNLATGSNLKINSQKNNYKPNETAAFTINKLSEDFIGGILFEVVKTDTTTYPESTNKPAISPYTPSEKIKIYNGLTLRGKVVTTIEKVAVNNETILFSIPDTIPQINYSTTNENGEFQFYIEDYFGTQTAYVQTLNKNEELNIELYPMFLLPPTELPYYIPVETEESDFIKLAIKRASFTKAYQTVDENEISIDSSFKYPFYGLPKQVVYPSLFIDLIDFNEISKEILPLVKYKYTPKETTIKIYDPVSKNFYNNPWVLVDGVPVSDFASINKFNSASIKWIEIQPNIRCFGNLLIEGMVSIFSKNGNFHDLNTPKNGLKTTIDTYYKQKEHNSSNNLLFKDILHWDPFLEFTKSSTIKVNCSLEKGSYAAIAQSIDSKGEIHRSVYTFTVSE